MTAPLPDTDKRLTSPIGNCAISTVLPAQNLSEFPRHSGIISYFFLGCFSDADAQTQADVPLFSDLRLPVLGKNDEL
jgi:hypothetical protein